MCSIKILYIFVISINSVLSLLECPQNCSCLLSGNEIQCPPKNSGQNGLIIHIEKEIKVDCYDPDFFPRFSNLNKTEIVIGSCPIPIKFSTIIAHFIRPINVESLTLNNIKFDNSSLPKIAFNDLPNLKRFTLHNTDIINLDGAVFENTPKLIWLELSNNAIQFQSDVFQSLSELSRLEIVANNNTVLPSKIFNGLRNLKTLHLRDNNLKELPEHCFDRLENLSVLELSGNKITEINGKLFKDLKNLTAVSLRDNLLSHLPENIFSENLKLKHVTLNINRLKRLPNFLLANQTDLKILELSHNELEELPSELLEGSDNIETIHLEGNKLKTLSTNVFKDKLKLQKLYLSHNELEELPPELLEGSDNIEIINLEWNKLKTLSTNVFKDKLKLQKLYLGHNNLNCLNSTIFKDLIELRLLDLQFNNINSLDETMLGGLTKIKELNLNDNNIFAISPSAFDTNINLKVINLSNNKLTLNTNPFEHLSHMQTLNLSYNLITLLPFTIRSGQSLDLSHNNITFVELNNFHISENDATINISFNQITTITPFFDEPRSSVRIKLSNNSIKCDCKIFNVVATNATTNVLFDNLICSEPQHLAGVQVLKLNPTDLICPLQEFSNFSECPSNCSCWRRPKDSAIVIDCSYKNLTKIPRFPIKSKDFESLEVNLEGNDLTEGPLERMLEYTFVTKLNLSHNHIKSLSWLPSGLKTVDIHDNFLTNLKDSIVESLRSPLLSTIKLQHNPWNCDCELAELISFLHHYPEKIDGDGPKCKDSNISLISLSALNVCQIKHSLYLIIPTLIIVVIALFIISFLLWRDNIKIWLYSKNLCLCFFKETEHNDEFDAFISYADEDECFVNKLVAQLNREPYNYNFYLTKENWIPGEFTQDEILKAVRKSSKTVIILSPNYVKCPWLMQEFQVARSEQMRKNQVRLIVVLFDGLDFNTLDEDIKIYLKTNTYLKWDEQNFLSKLLYALPHKGSKMTKSNTKNQSNKIINRNSDFSDSVPSVSDEGSTLLKKNPLNSTKSTKLKIDQNSL